MAVASLVACTKRAVVAVNGTYDAEMSCAEMESLYSRNLGTIAEVTEEQLWTNPSSSAVKAGIVLAGYGYYSAMQQRYKEQEAQVQYAVRENRKMEGLVQEKNCDPLAPPMDTFIAQNNARLKAKMDAFEEEEAAREKLDETYKREDGGQ